MRVSWLIAGFGIGVLAGALTRRQRRRTLGVTARKGPRTGAIEVDPLEVDTRVGQLLRQFSKCTNADGVRGLQPQQEGSATPFSARDAETGELRSVHVLLRPKRYKRPWIDGGGTAVLRAPHGRLIQEIVVSPNAEKCAPAAHWEPFLTKVLVHEAGHSSDPALVKSLYQPRKPTRRPRKEIDADANFVAYVNSPEETTAQLVEVEHELRRSQRTQPWLWTDDFEPDRVLKAGSQRYAELVDKLTVKNQRRYLRLAARLVDERQSKRRRSEDSDAVFRRMQIDAYREKYARR